MDVYWLPIILSKQEGVERAFYTPTYYEGNPVLKADKKWELGATGDPLCCSFQWRCGYDD